MSSDHAEREIAAHVRRLRVRALRDRLRESLLFLPALMLVVSVAVGLVLAWVDTTNEDRDLPWPLTFAPSTASTLLGTIAGAMITTAGVVFSLLVVSLQLASGQFSPRVLRGFWRDRFGQILVGLLLSTFAFCVLALARLDPDDERAPVFTVIFALLLTLASVVAIVVYLDRISRQQYVGRIMARAVGETLDLIRELPYGDHVGKKAGKPVPPPDTDALGPPFIVRSPGDGWVQQISRRAVITAAPPGSVVRLETRVGGYLVKHAPFASVWPPPDDPESFAHVMGEAVILGTARTMQQDIDFGLRQLNDIALRALSPATNDPTTAIEVVLRIGSIMRPLVLADLPAQSVMDHAGRILLTPFDLDHMEYVSHAFDQLRLYGAPHPQVLIAILRTLRMLRGACVLAGDRPHIIEAIDHEIKITVEGCAPQMHPEDRARVEAAAAS